MSGLITLAGLAPQRLQRLVTRACELQEDRGAHQRPLTGMVAGMMFLQTSTRTRTSFTTAAMRLGAQVIGYGPGDLQLNTGETVADTGRVFSAMLDLLVARIGAGNDTLMELTDDGTLPVVNAMSADEHPTQAITDLATIQLCLGGLRGVRLLYVGEGNNTAVALARALALVPGTEASFWTPDGFGLPTEVIEDCRRVGAERGSRIVPVRSRAELPTEADVVYTSRWQTTGTSKGNPNWRELFRPLHIDRALVERWPQARVMHDLPAQRGEEISGEVLDGPRSIAWTQAAMKLSTAMAVLEGVTDD